MSLQYISDSEGKTTGVFIPIEEWNKIRQKLKELGVDEINIPDWHLVALDQRMEEYLSNPAIAMDFEQTMNDLEKEL